MACHAVDLLAGLISLTARLPNGIQREYEREDSGGE
jgi:hypothetical protein